MSCLVSRVYAPAATISVVSPQFRHVRLIYPVIRRLMGVTLLLTKNHYNFVPSRRLFYMQYQSPDYHYLRFKITPPTKDALMIRKTITDCLVQSFGSTMASMYLDILWVDDSPDDDDDDDDDDGKECVIRTHIMYKVFF